MKFLALTILLTTTAFGAATNGGPLHLGPMGGTGNCMTHCGEGFALQSNGTYTCSIAITRSGNCPAFIAPGPVSPDGSGSGTKPAQKKMAPRIGL